MVLLVLGGEVFVTEFDEVAVKRMITGKDTVVAHGTADMPVWGPVFTAIEDKEHAVVRAKNLVHYLQTIQEK